ncbi:hypothetical protein GCM10010922_02940 [Microbacterium sorbitolivorans]|uniref:Type II secretion system protein n=1 Tax=Microbacterium sorbitolivorans TaxID=1867410 RepID=A0A367Y6P7_9MICO|nr:type II secretion system protein [Microbacterium sorbitolivorans]RCK61543.1 type II secretion system protein [Microbacterium sorbitolivorans]GGF31296.1 hypothetical protein GCM10010922_02940 [Microbacterium sorbitolivorans]
MTNKLSNTFKQRRDRGFTIVELLIVIVVIAILAAITIVSYNGISNRAKASAAASAAEQAAKKVAIYAVTNGEALPSALADAGVTDGNGTSYQYRTYDSGRKYCITATANGVSSYIDNDAQTSPKAGACPGHGVDGGGVVTNYATRPTPAEGNFGGWTGYNLAGGASSSVVPNAWLGKYSYRWTAGAPGFSNGSMNIGLEHTGVKIAVPTGVDVVPSIHVRASKGGSFTVSCAFSDSTGTIVTGSCPGPSFTVAANVWTRLQANDVTVPANASRMSIRAKLEGGATYVSGDWIEVSGVSTAPGAYADGDSPGWVWNGTPNNSTSTGPAL